MNEVFIFNTARSAVKSIIMSASVYPKPGLITPIDNNAIDGTEFPVLIDGAMALFHSFINFASAGADTESVSPEDVFTILKPSGKFGINDSLRATRGKLSLKGHVLCVGLLCAAAGRLLAQKRILTRNALVLTASSFAQGLTERELWPLTENGHLKVLTSGEKSYVSYGLEGCRGEAEHGYTQTVKALETLTWLEATQGQLNAREMMTHTLMTIMTDNGDTEIAGKLGVAELMNVQSEAKKVIDRGGMLSPDGVEAVLEMDKTLRLRGVSPSGSSVILSCAVFIRELMKMKLTRSGYDE